MRNLFWLLFIGVMSTNSLIRDVVWAQSTPEVENTENSDQIDLDELSCRMLLEVTGEERSNIVIFMHGYVSGQNGEKLINGPDLAEVTEKVIDDCIDNPDKQLLTTFIEFRE